MQVRISIPSKTFLLGEYAILKDGQALVACTSPRFELDFQLGGEGRCHGIHPMSPAGQWVRANHLLFESQDMNFIDPHQGQGGFGASTAQFLAVYAFKTFSEKSFNHWSGDLDEPTLLKHFMQWAWDGEGQAPSGADLIAQTYGGLSLVSKAGVVDVRKIDWPFAGKSFAILRTGKKAPSHEHLKKLQFGDVRSLKQLMEEANKALQEPHWSSFCLTVDRYFENLKERGWQSEHTTRLVQTLKSFAEIDAVKGCGALGADTLAIFFDSRAKGIIREKVQSLNLGWVADSSELAEGLKAEVNLGWDSVQNTPERQPESSCN